MGTNFINFSDQSRAWNLNTVAEIVVKVNDYAKKNGLNEVLLEGVEDNTWEDPKNQRFDVTISYLKNGQQIRQKLLILKGEVLDGMEFHRRFNEFYGEKEEKGDDLGVFHFNDPGINATNVAAFIKDYTFGSVCFQGDGKGRFYAKAGSFEFNEDPDLQNNGGTLIYSAEGTEGIKSHYARAACLSNLMNYILAKTRGEGYGSETPLFKQAKEKGSHYEAATVESLKKGFYNAYGSDSSFSCSARGCAGGYGYDRVVSDSDYAVWW